MLARSLWRGHFPHRSRGAWPHAPVLSFQYEKHLDGFCGGRDFTSGKILRKRKDNGDSIKAKNSVRLGEGFVQKGLHREQECKVESDSGNSKVGKQFTYFSFYKYFVPDDLESFRGSLEKAWLELGVLGRIYVAQEGINAQLVVPSENVDQFLSKLEDFSEFRDLFVNTGGQLTDPPFDKLQIKRKKYILHDGLDIDIDLTGSENEQLSPEEWHDKLTNNPDDVVLLDCRNDYEHEIGRFENSKRVMVNVFRDTFSELDGLLKKEDNIAKKTVMIYCTGGIRCEKVGGYLRSVKGLPSVKSLRGGIVNYGNFLKSNPGVKSKFLGKNFVFDHRARGDHPELEFTDDVLSVCDGCGKPYDSYQRCASPICGNLVLLCPSCYGVRLGACSTSCKSLVEKANCLDDPKELKVLRQTAVTDMKEQVESVEVGSQAAAPDMNPAKEQGEDVGMDTQNVSNQDSYWQFQREVETYATEHSTLVDSVKYLREETKLCLDRTDMMSSEHQAAFLKFFVESIGARQVLEIGTYSGYASFAMAKGLHRNGTLLTCDIDPDATALAKRWAKKLGESRIRFNEIDGLEFMEGLKGWKFDFIYVDGNKKPYKAYYDKILELELLSHRGIAAFDNTLFKGRVLEFTKKEKIAKSLHEFNEYVQQDPRTKNVLMPLWDGLTLFRSRVVPGGTSAKSKVRRF